MNNTEILNLAVRKKILREIKPMFVEEKYYEAAEHIKNNVVDEGERQILLDILIKNMVESVYAESVFDMNNKIIHETAKTINSSQTAQQRIAAIKLLVENERDAEAILNEWLNK